MTPPGADTGKQRGGGLPRGLRQAEDALARLGLLPDGRGPLGIADVPRRLGDRPWPLGQGSARTLANAGAGRSTLLGPILNVFQKASLTSA